tara:strand:- start:34724 stop:35596 length:873 start_codon:yes stop_codon:yes gene_type:complete
LILNFGSINIDNVYRVTNLVTAGETVAAKSFDRVLGGKGINQSIAIARAGGAVFHVGNVGQDTWILDQLTAMDVDQRHIRTTDIATGHAIISVDDAGENEIVIFAGANNAFDMDECTSILEKYNDQAPWIVLQNEINLTTEIAAKAKSMGCKVCYSAAPFDADKVRAVLPYVDLLALNETEFADLRAAMDGGLGALNVGMVLVTLGAKGAELMLGDQRYKQNSFPVTPIDTTGAGDTFLGSFISRLDLGDDAKQALQYAAAAAAIQVTRMGAAPAIPNHMDVTAFLQTRA